MVEKKTRLELLRLERGLSQRELAKRADVHVNTVQRVEAKGVATPMVRTRLARALGVPLVEAMSLTDQVELRSAEIAS